MKKLLPKRRLEWKPSDKGFALRKNTAALEEDAQILKVIKAYCTRRQDMADIQLEVHTKKNLLHKFCFQEEKIIVEGN